MGSIWRYALGVHTHERKITLNAYPYGQTGINLNIFAIIVEKREQKMGMNILENRGLDIEILVKYGVETFKQGGIEHCKFPYKRNGEIVNTKYRTIEGEKKFWQDGGVKCVWNEDCLRDETLQDQTYYTANSQVFCRWSWKKEENERYGTSTEQGKRMVKKN